MSVAVFYLKYEVTHLESEVDRLNRAIVTDSESIHVLEAEWSHLNEAERIRELAEKYLEMKPTRPDQIVRTELPPDLPGEAESRIPNVTRARAALSARSEPTR